MRKSKGLVLVDQNLNSGADKDNLMPYIPVANTQLYYEDTGGPNEIILFSPGLLMSTALFSKQIDFFKASYRCIVYDHRGQGQSEDNALIDIETNYNDTIALIEALNIHPLHFVGVSMGGFVGLRIAVRRPQLLKSLTLMATDSEGESFTSTLKFKLLLFLWTYLPTKYIVPLIMKEMFGKTFLSNAEREGEIEFWRKHFAALKPYIAKSVRGVVERAGITKKLNLISSKLPTLILSGEEDIVFNTKIMNTLQQNIPCRIFYHTFCRTQSVL